MFVELPFISGAVTDTRHVAMLSTIRARPLAPGSQDRVSVGAAPALRIPDPYAFESGHGLCRRRYALGRA